MAVNNLPVESATPATKYILSTDSRQRVYEHACNENKKIFDKKSQRKRGHAKREQDPGYKAGLGSEMNILCMKPKCWDPIVKRPRTLKDHHFVKHEEVVVFHCGPCGEEFVHSHHFDYHLQNKHGCRSYCSMLHFTVVHLSLIHISEPTRPY